MTVCKGQVSKVASIRDLQKVWETIFSTADEILVSFTVTALAYVIYKIDMQKKKKRVKVQVDIG